MPFPHAVARTVALQRMQQPCPSRHTSVTARSYRKELRVFARVGGLRCRARLPASIPAEMAAAHQHKAKGSRSPRIRVASPVNRDHTREHERKSEFCFAVGNETRNPPGRGHNPIKCWRVAYAQVAEKPNRKSGCVNRPADALGIWHPTPRRTSHVASTIPASRDFRKILRGKIVAVYDWTVSHRNKMDVRGGLCSRSYP
jgi:hypothetical protein